MGKSEILLGLNRASFAEMVCQTEVQSEEDKKRFQEEGYFPVLTEDEMSTQFGIDAEKVVYVKTIGQNCLYFNRETLAVSIIPIEMHLMNVLDKEQVLKAIELTEERVSKGDYMGCIMSLPDSMKLEYFQYLIDKKEEVEDIYELFFDTYRSTDFGFRQLDEKVINQIIEEKSRDDKFMTEEKIKDFPHTVEVYRGGNSASTPYEKAYSWTTDMNIAQFFASRLGNDEGYIVKGEVAKEDIIDYFDERNEKEVIIKPDDVKIIDEIKIKGFDYIKDILSEITPMYQQYRDKMDDLTFAMDSLEHGKAHQARVLLLALTIAEDLGMSVSDKKILAEAAIYHDTRRIHDGDDEEHGRYARAYYNENLKRPHPIVEFLIEYHSRDDEDGMREIMNNKVLSKTRSKVTKLYQVFKDADALDRVRFGLKGIDMNYLRLPISKELSLVARIYLEQIKVDPHVKLMSRKLDDVISLANAQKEKNKSCQINKMEKDRKGKKIEIRGSYIWI